MKCSPRCSERALINTDGIESGLCITVTVYKELRLDDVVCEVRAVLIVWPRDSTGPSASRDERVFSFFPALSPLTHTAALLYFKVYAFTSGFEVSSSCTRHVVIVCAIPLNVTTHPRHLLTFQGPLLPRRVPSPNLPCARLHPRIPSSNVHLHLAEPSMDTACIEDIHSTPQDRIRRSASLSSLPSLVVGAPFPRFPG
ncbi:hypothetical protein HYPSUDRAFT_220664 [Hypholoma sublateritium FD-334 SS-4]|uniref:Uncharacterized protein n=1 Tax=Hypholoma sublateritium (strain FD-334 SS-4) TaxID=945553 RepID=A0A0D2LT33_HYPSF|nr:hypothetical protein HYPSUDRAFT_220664 [Hypholoma sublateritium FD-334 SS-4]